MQLLSNALSFRRTVFATAVTLAFSPAAMAAGEHGGGHGSGASTGGHMQGMSVGQPGKAAEAKRTIAVAMTDNRYDPEKITVAKGETVRFVISNKGQLVHEFNIGTAAMHAAHQKEMAMMAEHGALEADKINHDKMKMDMGGGKTMEHNDPNSVLLEPGKSGEVVWKFTEAAQIEFACNVPGHYDAGMVGNIQVK